MAYHNYPQLVFTCAVWISYCLDDLYVTFLLRFAAPFEVEHVPFVAGDFGDRAVLFKPDGWEASNLETFETFESHLVSETLSRMKSDADGLNLFFFGCN